MVDKLRVRPDGVFHWRPIQAGCPSAAGSDSVVTVRPNTSDPGDAADFHQAGDLDAADVTARRSRLGHNLRTSYAAR